MDDNIVGAGKFISEVLDGANENENNIIKLLHLLYRIVFGFLRIKPSSFPK